MGALSFTDYQPSPIGLLRAVDHLTSLLSSKFEMEFYCPQIVG